MPQPFSALQSRTLLLVALGLLTACGGIGEVVSDVYRGDPWCAEREHAVVTGESASPDTRCWDPGTRCTLDIAIRSANSCRLQQTLVLESGANYELSRENAIVGMDSPRRFTRHQALPLVTGNIVIEGNGATISPGAVRERQLFIVTADASLTLRNVTLQGANSDNPARTARGADGPALFNSGTVLLERVTVRNNITDASGGAIYNQGELTIRESVLSNNEAGISMSGGAVSGPGNLFVERSTFSGNRATKGGAIAIEGGSASISKSTFSGNTTPLDIGEGGAIYVLQRSSILRVSSSTVSANTATSGGGVVVAGAGEVVLRDVTVARNVVGGAPPVVSDLRIDETMGVSAQLTNVLVEGVGSNPACGIISAAAGSHGLSSDDSCVSAGLIRGNPRLGPLTNNGGTTETMLPGSGSDAVDRGRDCLPEDQRGLTRPVRACDIGAVEVE